MKTKFVIFAAVAAVLMNVTPVTVQADSSTDDTAGRIYSTLVEAGYSHAGACGILGNIAVENPEFNPRLESPDGTYYGLFQWSDVGDRRTHLYEFCKPRLFKPDRITGQMAFAFYELQGGDSIACRLDSFLRETDDAKLAAMEFAAGFERCIGETSVPENDAVYIGNIYPEYYERTYQALQLRIDKAVYYEELFREISPTIVDSAIVVSEKTFLQRIGATEDKWILSFVSRLHTNTSPQAEGFSAFMLRLLCITIGYGFGSISFISFFSRHRIQIRHRLRDFSHANTDYTPIIHMIIVIIRAVTKIFLAYMAMLVVTNEAIGREGLLYTGLGVILGNDFPFWNRFRGEINTGITIVILCTYMPLWGPICILFGAVVLLTSNSRPVSISCILLFAVPFAFYAHGFETGFIVMVVILLMLRKHYKHLFKRLYKRFLSQT